MKKDTKAKLRSLIIPAIVLVIIAVLAATGIYRCPFKLVTGFPCPLCGTTRAVVSALKGDIKASFEYHPLWPLTIVTVVVIMLGELGFIKLGKRWKVIIPVAIGVLLLGCYILRIVTGTLPS